MKRSHILLAARGVVNCHAAHIGFVADGPDGWTAPYAAAIAAGGADNCAPVPQLSYDPRYYAANVLDPDGGETSSFIRAGSTLMHSYSVDDIRYRNVREQRSAC